MKGKSLIIFFGTYLYVDNIIYVCLLLFLQEK